MKTFNEESKFEQIIEDGLERIDAAIEGVIYKYTLQDARTKLFNYIDTVHGYDTNGCDDLIKFNKSMIESEIKAHVDIFGLWPIGTTQFKHSERAANYALSGMIENMPIGEYLDRKLS